MPPTDLIIYVLYANNLFMPKTKLVFSFGVPTLAHSFKDGTRMEEPKRRYAELVAV